MILNILLKEKKPQDHTGDNLYRGIFYPFITVSFVTVLLMQ